MSEYLNLNKQQLADIVDRLKERKAPAETLAPRSKNNIFGFDDLMIRTDSRQIVPLVPNRIQSDYLDKILPQWRQRGVAGLRGLKDIILKGRQFGLSTLWIGIFFLDTINVPHTQTVIIAHDATTSERMFQIVHRMYHHLPADKRPQTKFENRRELYWPELDSSFYVGVPGTRDFGRALTINNVLASEVPSWANAESVMTGLLESVPEAGNFVVESTAKGFGNWYQKEWQAAQNGNSIFTPRFFCWLDEPKYRLNPEDFKRRQGVYPKAAIDYYMNGMTAEEKQLSALYGATEEQLLWRRQKMLTQRTKFRQEYPTTPDEAFLLTGNPYFDIDRLSVLSKKLDRGEFAPIEAAKLLIPSGFRYINRNRDMLKVWRYPQPGRTYVMGADTAEGVRMSGDHDYDCLDVFDAQTWEQVAQFHGRVDTHEFGWVCAELGWWFNMALLAVERNNHGHSVLNTLIYSANYPLMDRTAQGGLYLHEEYDHFRDDNAPLPGWPTNPKTKYLALDFLRTSIDDGTLVIQCKETVSELMNYIKLPSGKAGGEGGSHDDRVSSAALVAAMLNLRPKEIGDPISGEELPAMADMGDFLTASNSIFISPLSVLRG